MAGTAFVLHHRHRSFEPSFEAGHMPACDSATVRHLLGQPIDQAPDAQRQHVKVLKLGAMSDTTRGMEPEEQKARPERRQCVAEVYTNGGHDLVLFTVDWTTDSKDEIDLEIPELPF